jgi:pimeloyl-ACP methyl ester carboxylesterase
MPGSAGHVLLYRSYPLETKNAAIRRALIVVHGLLRDADSHFRASMAGAFLADALDDTLVIAPRFASDEGGDCDDSLAAGEIAWHCDPRFDSWRAGGASVDASTTSFDVMDEILRKLDRKDVFPNLRAIVVAGHSGGGQFASRYEMANVVHEGLTVKPSYVVMNPSSYAYLDGMRPARNTFMPYADRANCTTYDTWPYGMKDRNGYAARLSEERLKAQLAARPTTYMVGELDVLPIYGFDSSCPAMAQGPTRLARGRAYAKYVSERYGAKHAFVEVDACGHSARCMLTSEQSLPLLFPKP